MKHARKTDNAFLPGKLALRRHFLARYHTETPPRVLDCCAGGGVIWRQLRKEFELASYFPTDRKRTPGRVRILDSARILALPGIREDVIDVDTYGLPWKHWTAILRNLSRPTTVFLTIGRVLMGGVVNLSRDEEEVLGLRFKRLRLPVACGGRLIGMATDHFLALPLRHGIRIVEAQEVRSAHAQYVGLRLEPATA